MQFEEIGFARQDEYLELLARCPQAASDYSFGNLWGWAEEYGLTWAFDDDLVWIKQSRPQPCFWAPVGEWRQVDWGNRLAGFPPGQRFIRVPSDLWEIWQRAGAEGFVASESREHWDYLYETEALVKLAGNRYHAKKNLLSQFVKNHPFEYMNMESAMVEQSLLMQLDWCAWRNCEASAGLSSENRVITRTLKAWKRFNRLVGGAILVNGRVAAFTVGEFMRPDTLVIHFEKGLAEFKGIYQAINQMFLADQPAATLVNREQDLGNTGLRKAKLSYHPVDFIRKFEIKMAGPATGGCDEAE